MLNEMITCTRELIKRYEKSQGTEITWCPLRVSHFLSFMWMMVSNIFSVRMSRGLSVRTWIAIRQKCSMWKFDILSGTVAREFLKVLIGLSVSAKLNWRKVFVYWFI